MKIIKPSYEIITPVDREYVLKHIERAARICYKSEDKTTESSSSNMVRSLIKSGHHSVIEHFSFSVKFICDRGVLAELTRHRLASFSVESTRYCNYTKDKFDNQLTFIIPNWFTYYIPGEYDKEKLSILEQSTDPKINKNFYTEFIWLNAMKFSEDNYLNLIKLGWQPQQARSILPNSLKTEIVCTANLREWIHILKLRTSQAAHPQIREIMLPLLNELKNILPEFFENM